MYATDETGLNPGSSVWFWKASIADETENEMGVFSSLMQGSTPKPGQRIVYVDGGFDLFSSGHIEFLRKVIEAEEKLAEGEDWYSREAVEERVGKGADYAPCFVVAGVHDDEVINHWKGVNYPIMNIYERGLCVLQCKVFVTSQSILNNKPNSVQYVNAVIFSAPFTPNKAYLTTTPWGVPDAVYHGPTSFMPLTYDPYVASKEMGIYRSIGNHEFASVNAGQIVQRILRSRDMYEERQRVKGVKGIGEEAQRTRERMEKEQRLKESNAQNFY